MNDIYILTHGDNGCDVPFTKIKEMAEAVQEYYHFSSPIFLMWKAFQFGFAYGKRAERARRKKTS